MRISEKILLTREGLEKEGPITIVAFGDSVTHGALLNEINYETVYHNRLRKKLSAVRSYMPINVINAGIGGTNAAASLGRMDKQVLAHNPDLIIVCFGLNDVVGELDVYLNALEQIFEKGVKSGAEVIFMTPNMLNTYIADDTQPEHREWAKFTAECQTSGKMDLFMSSAAELAEKMGVEVCDCYSEWKKLAETQDTTQLLVNKINHPTAEMHELFADKLFEVIFKDKPEYIPEISSTMAYDTKKN